MEGRFGGRLLETDVQHTLSKMKLAVFGQRPAILTAYQMCKPRYGHAKSKVRDVLSSSTLQSGVACVQVLDLVSVL